MSDEKILITMDEVARATPVPGTPPPPDFNSEYAPPESDAKTKPKNTRLFAGIGIAVIALLCISVVGIMAIVLPSEKERREPTVSDYRAKTIREISEELSKPDSKLKKRIEDAHLTVKVKSSEIVRCDVTTVDGSEKTGRDDSNIDKVSMLIRFNWEGFIDKGYTDLRIEYDVQNKRLLESKIDQTTALVNVEDPSFWYDVGYIIGATLAL